MKNLTAREKISKFTSGFTLVELLIVISLLGVIALIVIAAINPIEQANRARDTRMKADAAQLISAIDRYFATHSVFPWVTAGEKANNEVSFGFISAIDTGVGICGADCSPSDRSTDGLLITTEELKTEFKNRDFVQTDVAADELYIGKASGTASSVYACFVPASQAERSKAVDAGKVYTIDTSNGSRSQTDACNDTSVVWADTGCYVCVPE